MKTLREWRLSQKPKVTKRALAIMSGVSEATLNNIERGKGCALKTATAIVNATKGEVTYEMLTGSQDENIHIQNTISAKR